MIVGYWCVCACVCFSFKEKCTMESPPSPQRPPPAHAVEKGRPCRPVAPQSCPMHYLHPHGRRVGLLLLLYKPNLLTNVYCKARPHVPLYPLPRALCKLPDVRGEAGPQHVQKAKEKKGSPAQNVNRHLTFPAAATLTVTLRARSASVTMPSPPAPPSLLCRALASRVAEGDSPSALLSPRPPLCIAGSPLSQQQILFQVARPEQQWQKY